MDWNKKRQLVLKNTMKYGRQITLVRDGDRKEFNDPLGPSKEPVTVPGVWGVFVLPAGNLGLGAMFGFNPGLTQNCEQVAIVLPSLEHDFTKFNRVIDTDDSEWKIDQYDELRPSIVPIVSYLGLVR